MVNDMYSKAFIFFLFLFVASAEAQMSRRTPVPPSSVPAVTATETRTEETVEIVPASLKKNARPASASAAADIVQTAVAAGSVDEYHYEFVQPAFLINRIVIRHDESGKGTVTFYRKDNPEPVTDPIRVSPAAIRRIKAAYDSLNFLDSTDSYQHARDFSHLGTAKFTLTRGEKSRTAEFNWTDNRNAKVLADEYRKIGNEYIWRFEIDLARQTQPLETPRLMTRLDSLLRRNEISDPPSMLPFLNELSNDERLPLMARNASSRMAKQIERQAEKARK